MAEKTSTEGGILITGAGGFLGGSAAEKLISQGEKVIATDLNTNSELAQKLHLRSLDTSNREETKEFVWDNLPDSIFHYAGISIPREVADNEKLGQKVNIESVMNLLDAITAARKRNNTYNPTILVAGTVEQFGEPKSGSEVMDELSPRHPGTPYGEQKQQMVSRFLTRCFQEKLTGFAIIQAQVSGSSLSGEISQKPGFFISDVASQVAAIEASGRDQGIIVTGVVDNLRPIMNVKDAIDGWVNLAQKNPKPGEYIVCAAKSRPLKDVLDILIKFSTVELFHEIDGVRGKGGKDRFYSHGKITRATGWKPEIELEQTVREVLEFQRRFGKRNE